MKDEKCAWIFVAAWRRPGYIAMLNVANEKTTVLEGSSLRNGFDQMQLGVPFNRFPHIFQRPDTHKLHPAFLPAYHPTTGPQSTKRLPGRLPTPAQAIPNHIPLNKHGERLDIATPLPSTSLRHEFHRRFPPGAIQPCNWHHLAGRCRGAVACAYDHSEMTAGMLVYRRFQTSLVPCAEGSGCRRLGCFYGHVCRMWKCEVDGEGCSMRVFHRVEPEVVEWVEGW